MTIRQAKLGDVQSIIEIENRAWPNGGGATQEQFISRIKTFPEGVILAETNSKIIGVVAGQIIKSSYLSKEKINWQDITDHGYIKTTHNPAGDALFGVDLSVDPLYRKSGVGKKLLLEIGKMAIRRNLKVGILGARMPEYYKYSKEVTPEAYLNFRGTDGRLVDSELRFYERNGLSLVRVIEEYFPDKESLNYGVLAVWKNPFYVRNRVIGRMIGLVGSLVFRI